MSGVTVTGSAVAAPTSISVLVATDSANVLTPNLMDPPRVLTAAISSAP
jgi:hypothetical protein